MATAQALQFTPQEETSCIHSIELGEYFLSPFNEDAKEVLIRTASGATSICTGEEFPIALFELEEDDEEDNDEYLLELVPAGELTLEIA